VTVTWQDLDEISHDESGAEDGSDIVMYLTHDVEPRWMADRNLEWMRDSELFVFSNLWMYPRRPWPGREAANDADSDVEDESTPEHEMVGEEEEEEEEEEPDDVGSNGLRLRERLRIKAWPISSIHMNFLLKDKGAPSESGGDQTRDFQPYQVASILRGRLVWA
jgi:hypothetical protein